MAQNLLPVAILAAFHDAALASREHALPALDPPALAQAIADNHRYNCLLWDEEDLARRPQVGDALIAANKRAIDGYNQKRNDATERIDEALLAALPPMSASGRRRNSETAGAMVDRLSILALKVHHMALQTERRDASAEHIARCHDKLALLREQRADLLAALDTLLCECIDGVAFFKIYRQFKMYNDPSLNPQIYGAQAPGA